MRPSCLCKSLIPTILLTVAIVLALPPSDVRAQSFRYIDEAGTIHWADSLAQVPPRYRNQVLEPTPVPTGKPRRIRLTPTPKPTKTPKPKKTPKHRSKKEEPADRSAGKKRNPLFLGNYGAPGQLPTITPPVPPQAQPATAVSQAPAIAIPTVQP